MPEYDNTNRGVLFKNEEKESETHADYAGTINVDGTEFWLNAWIKEAKSGKKFMSLSVKPKQQKVETRTHRPAQKLPGNIQDMDDSIPFADPYKGRKSYVV
jgi:hypothetical protein